MLTMQPVTLKTYPMVRALYHAAFPARERLPLWLLTLLSGRRRADFLALSEGEAFAGFAYLVHDADLTLVLYLAVERAQRARGLGGQALAAIKARFPSHSFVLNIEPVVPSDNLLQRQKRLRFYLQNGFEDTGYSNVSGGETYQVLYCGGDFSPERYAALVRRFSFGFVRDTLFPAR